MILLKHKPDPITPLLKTTFSTAYKALNNQVFIIFPWSPLLFPPPSLCSSRPGCFDVSRTCQANMPASKPFHLLFSLPETFFPQMSTLFTISPSGVESPKGRGVLSLIYSLLFPHSFEKWLAWNSCSINSWMTDTEIVTETFLSVLYLKAAFRDDRTHVHL